MMEKEVERMNEGKLYGENALELLVWLGGCAAEGTLLRLLRT